MFDEIFAGRPADVTGKLGATDPDTGVKVGITFAIAPCGDILNPEVWHKRNKTVKSISAAGTMVNGVKASVSMKDITAAEGKKAISILLGVKSRTDELAIEASETRALSAGE